MSAFVRCASLLLWSQFMSSSGGVKTGTETIAAIRALGVGALIVGSSGNDLEAEHLNAGADLFWRKPTPGAAKMVQDISSKLSLPSAWRVLFADDDMIVSFCMQRKLETALPGADVRLVSSGAAALKAIAANGPYDLVIVDMHMGNGASGADVARLVRAGENPGGAAAAIIVGFSGDSVETEFLAAGCDLCWSKSIDTDEIKSSLMKCTPTTSSPHNLSAHTRSIVAWRGCDAYVWLTNWRMQHGRAHKPSPKRASILQLLHCTAPF